MKTSISYWEMADKLEDVLKETNCVFYKSSSKDMLEFHVREPFEIIFRITHLEERMYPSLVLGFFLPSRQDECTDVQIIPRGGKESEKLASGIVKLLVERLPKKPWEGLGLIESLTSKALWKEWMKPG